MKKSFLILSIIFSANLIYAFKFGTVNLGREVGRRVIEELVSSEYHDRDPRLVFVTDPAVEGTSYWGSVAIANDTIYYGTSGIDNEPEGVDYINALYAFDKNTGKIKWKFTIDEDEVVKGAIVIGPDGTIYFITIDMPYENAEEGSTYLYAINSDGTKKWKKKISDVKPHYWGQESPAVDKDGTIYVNVNVSNSMNSLFAFKPDGSINWEFGPVAQFQDGIWSAPTINEETIYLQTSYTLYAISRSNGSLLWKTQTNNSTLGDVASVVTSPIVGSDGTIYVGQGKFLVAYSNSSVKWQFDAKALIIAQPIIGPDGTIYVVTTAKEKEDSNKIAGYCWAIDPSKGEAKWMFNIDQWMYDEHDNTWKDSDNYGPAVVGKDGTLYFTTEYNYMWALNPDGSLKEIYDLGSMGSTEDKKKYPIGGSVTYSALAIDENGILYRPTFDKMNGKMYMVIMGIQTESQGLADSPWPKGYKNNKNTNCSP